MVLAKRVARAPGPSLLALTRSLPDLWRDPAAWFGDQWRRHGDVVRFDLGPWGAVHLVVHPTAVSEVLQLNCTNYPKHVFFNLFRTGLGEGLLASSGEHWKRQRRLVQPLVNHDQLDGMGATITRAACDTLQRWQNRAAAGEAIDLAGEMAGLARRIISRLIFGEERDSLIDNARRSFYAAAPWAVLLGDLPVGPRRRFDEVRAELDAWILPLIRARRAAIADGTVKSTHDLLSRLILARDPLTGAQMSDAEVRDECLTLVFTGHDTVAVTLTWALLQISEHPAVEAALAAELAMVHGDRPLALVDLGRLSYLDQVCREVLRLYPAAWTGARRVLAPATLGGHPIPAGSLVMFSPYLTHRHPSIWGEAERFDPGRFSPERSEPRAAAAFFPFGMGPRSCVGRHLAQAEIKLVLACLLPCFRLERMSSVPITVDSRVVVLRPRGPLWMRVRPRDVVAYPSLSHPAGPSRHCGGR